MNQKCIFADNSATRIITLKQPEKATLPSPPPHAYHGEIIYGGTRWIEDDCSATFSEYIFLFPACLMISHWLTKNAELNSVF